MERMQRQVMILIGATLCAVLVAVHQTQTPMLMCWYP